MANNDQIMNEQVQYDINWKAAKIAALSSGKTGQYDYLTGEEILPSNQKQIIEQANFTYPPLRKSYEKETKIMEDQGEKRVKAIKNNEKQLTNINADYNELLLSKEREICKNIYNERFDKIGELLKKKSDYDDLNFIAKRSGDESFFNGRNDAIKFVED